MCPYFCIGETQLPAYTVMILAGYAVGFLVIWLRNKINRDSMGRGDAFLGYLFAGIGAVAGGKIFAVVQGLPLFLQLHAERGYAFPQFFNEAGFVFYGALIGLILFLLLYAKLYRVPFWRLLDTIMPALPLAQALGRVGCFLAGCCYGIPVEWGIVQSPEGVGPHDTPLLPIQLIEAAACVVLFIVMMRVGRRARPDGYLPGVYCLGYGIIRFVDEFFRGDAFRGIAAGLSVSQWISLALIAAGIYLVFFYAKKPRATVGAGRG